MASKKGAVQQLQAEINSNEDFEKFMERDGLLVIDVYTEWCGPCLGMVGSLKKIKLELGGDNLQLAVCKADTVEHMARFRNKSEPTWLFGSNGKIINSLFGTNVPLLMKLIADELQNEEKYKAGEFERVFYEWSQFTPIEQVIEDRRIAILEEQERIEYEAEEARKRNFVIGVTDKIMQTVPDMGVAFIMPNHAKLRDIHKKITDPSEKCGLVIKDKRVLTIKQQEMFTMYFDCPNKLPDAIMENLFKSEILTVNFRQSNNEKPTTEMLKEFAKLLSAKHEVYDENEANPPRYLAPTLSPFQIMLFDYDGPEYESGDESDDILPPVAPAVKKGVKVSAQEQAENATATEEDKTQDEEQAGDVPQATQTEPFPDEVTGTEEKPLGTDEPNDENDDAPGSDEEQQIVKQPRVRVKVENVNGKMHMSVPAVWVPANARTNAALIYLYYRHFTEHFLPPDPIPEPHHLCMIFDAIKRREVSEVMEASGAEILAYGFFANIDTEKPELLAKTADLYIKRRPGIDDKLVVKAAKIPESNTILNLTGLGPSYVSLNTEIGRADCLKCFPKHYNAREEDEEEANAGGVGGKRKRKGKKNKKKVSDGSVHNPDTESNVSEDVRAEEDDDDDGDADEDKTSQLSTQTSMDKTSEIGVNTDQK